MVKKVFKIKSTLADAIGETINSARGNSGELHVEVIPLQKIELDPENPRNLSISMYDILTGISELDLRKVEEKKSLDALASTIEKQGVINPVLVYKHNDKYRLIAGERRVLASLIAKKGDIPAKILAAKPDEFKLRSLQWIENIHREDLSLFDRLNNLKQILNAHSMEHGKSIEDTSATEISKLVDCSLQQAVNYRSIIVSPSKQLFLYIESNQIKNIDKAAFIANSPSEFEKILIEDCLNGASLKNLKARLKTEKIKPIKTEKRGRIATKITFGDTSKVEVAKILINSVISNNEFHHVGKKIGAIDWKDFKSVSSAFKNLIKVLETSTNKG